MIMIRYAFGYRILLTSNKFRMRHLTDESMKLSVYQICKYSQNVFYKLFVHKLLQLKV